MVCSTYLPTTHDTQVSQLIAATYSPRIPLPSTCLSPGTPTPDYVTTRVSMCVRACASCPLLSLPSLRYTAATAATATTATVVQEQGTGAKRKKQPRRPMPIANSTVNHTPAHSQSPTPKHSKQETGTGLDGWSGCSTARRYHNSVYLQYIHPYIHTPSLRTYPGPRNHRAQWLFCLEKQASKQAVCVCAYVCAPAPKLWHL